MSISVWQMYLSKLEIASIISSLNIINIESIAGAINFGFVVYGVELELDEVYRIAGT
jgi:hypothetical protein